MGEPRGTSTSGGHGASLDLASTLEAKFRARSSQIQQIKRKTFGSYLKFRGHLSLIFFRKIWGSNKNFRGKFWGKPPDPLIWKYHPGWVKLKGLLKSHQKQTHDCEM